MIKKYKNFSVFKRTLKEGQTLSEKAPGYDALTSYQNQDGTFEKSLNIGGVWLKDGKDGSKYFSGKLSDTRTHEDNTYPGFCIVNEQELDKVLKLAEAMQQKLSSPLGDSYPTEVEPGNNITSNMNPADIPF